MYRDNSGNEFESYEAACHYYGVDTPAQAAAEDRYWAEEEAREVALAEMNDAVIVSRFEADALLHPEADYCPF